MPKLASKYEKGKVPAGLETFYTVEKDGFMCAEFEDDVAIVTNPALAANNAKLLTEKQDAVTKYNNLVASSGDLATEVNELRLKIVSGGQVSANELAIVTALKGIENVTPDSIKKMIDEHPKLQAQINTYQANEENSKIAKAMNWKPEVFTDLRPVIAKDLKFEAQDLTENGKTVTKVFVSGKNASGVDFKKEFSEYVKETPTFTNHLPSLQTTGQQTGPNWVAQNPADGGGSQTNNALAERIKAKNDAVTAQPNPLAAPGTPAPAPAAT